MKKVLFASYSLNVGGIETALITLLKNIKDKYEITLALEKKDGIFLNEIPENIKIIEYKPSTFKILAIRKAINFLKQTKFKLKYKNKFDFSVCYATYSLPCSFVARCSSQNNAIWIHNDYLSFYNNNVNEYKDFFNKLKISDFKKIVFVSENDRINFEKNFPQYKNNAITCNNLINYENILKLSNEEITDFKENKDLITFINLGRHEEKQKKISRIIEATKKLNKENYKFRVLFIGDGPDAENYRQSAEGIENIYFLGAKKNPYPYLKQSDCLIMSSDYEGYPVVYIESLILNKTIITTDVSDSKKDIENRYGIVTKKSTEDIYNAMKKYLENGFNMQSFNPQNYNQRILEKLNEIIN